MHAHIKLFLIIVVVSQSGCLVLLEQRRLAVFCKGVFIESGRSIWFSLFSGCGGDPHVRDVEGACLAVRKE